eukprot:425037_1
MSLNLQTQQTKILYLPLKDETLPNLSPHTTLKHNEHSKLKDIKSNTFDVCTGITHQSYTRPEFTEILRTLKPGGVIMLQIAKETDIKNDLLSIGFCEIESSSQQQITHWTARKPRTQSKRKSIKSESKSDAQEEDHRIITRYKTSKTSLGRFFIPICDDVDIHKATLVMPSVGVGNIGQIAMDILLTTLLAQQRIVKIGYINDRNVVCGVGNNGIIPKPKRKRKKTIEGRITAAVEVYWYKECNVVFIQQRCSVRMGGRGEFVDGLMQFINKYQFDKVVLLTSEYITKRNDFETKNGVKMVYYHSDKFDVNVMKTLKWIPSKVQADGDSKEEEFNVIGHGITRKLYKECVECEQSVVVVCQYSEDGDNTKESEMYLQNVVRLIDTLGQSQDKLSDIKKWKYPYSLSFANGGKLPNGIY